MTYAKIQAACASCASGFRALPSDTKRVMERMGSAGKCTYLAFVKWALPFSPSRRKPPQSRAPSDAPEDKVDAEPEAEEQPIGPTAESSDDAAEALDDATIEVSRAHRIIAYQLTQAGSALVSSP
jgi:hypothetical protein